MLGKIRQYIRQPVISIIEWIYVTTLPFQSESISHLLVYQCIILEAQLYSGEAWNVDDHHLCCIASTCLLNFRYLLPPGYIGIVINKYVLDAGNQRRPYYQHCLGFIQLSTVQCTPAPLFPSGREQYLHLTPPYPTSQKVSWLKNFSQCSSIL